MRSRLCLPRRPRLLVFHLERLFPLYRALQSKGRRRSPRRWSLHYKILTRLLSPRLCTTGFEERFVVSDTHISGRTRILIHTLPCSLRHQVSNGTWTPTPKSIVVPPSNSNLPPSKNCFFHHGQPLATSLLDLVLLCSLPKPNDTTMSHSHCYIFLHIYPRSSTS